MRTKNIPVLALALTLIGATANVAQPARGDDAPLPGSWKLVALPFGEDDFAIIKVTEKDGKATATVVDVQQMLAKNTVKTFETKNETLTLALTGPAGDTTFTGKLAREGAHAGQYLGTVILRGSLYPARLETTSESKVAPLKQGAIVTKFREAQKTTEPKAKVKKLEEAMEESGGSPANALFYTEILSAAEAAGLEHDKVADLVKKWIDETRPYGEAWTNDIRLRALKAVGTSKKFAKTTVGLAQDAEKVVAEDAKETRATVLGLLASAARASGMTELATESEARYTKLNDELDADYLKKVPPFKATTFAGRQNKKADQVVLMELFTGAQCPPCVAADVAFDSLLKTYQTAEFIGLQYHLHIPGPDPLTNRDSQKRQEYYGSEVHGTPSTFFNGKSEAGGGGGMANSKGKYDEYTEIINKSLEGQKGATIDVSATRAGEHVKIVASAKVTESGDKSDTKSDKPKRVLRLALTEESVRYAGGNKLRFHHHVVRALPGGADGKELKEGAGTIEIDLDLAQVKRDLESYLSDYAQSRKFPATPPEIKLDHLALVAFVQDDTDKSILHAVSVPVENARP